MDIAEAGHHVKDATSFHFPFGLHLDLPLIDLGTYQVGGFMIPLQLQLTKFMVLEVVVGLLMIGIFVPLAWRLKSGKPPKGLLTNLFDTILLFLRDQVARPAIGRHDADRFVPFLWTLFFFVLFCNLIGLVPWAGSPTGALAVTGTLAAVTFCTVAGAGMARFGAVGFWVGLVPHMELPLVLALFLKPMLFVIEVVGLCIKHGVLAVRLMANMFAGHLAVAVILGFIAAAADSWLVLWIGVTAASVLATVALYMLELFVAFLQAYIFAFLSALFIGMAVHKH